MPPDEPTEQPTLSETASISSEAGDEPWQSAPPVHSEVRTGRGQVAIGDHYPLDANFICDLCNDAPTDDISTLKKHVETAHETDWSAYLQANPLHRCAGCDDPLPTLEELYCESCNPTNNDTIPCQFCAVNDALVGDPFCSPDCAANGLEYGSPLGPPDNIDDTWLDSPYRARTGIPAITPRLASLKYICRECYDYGSDDLHSLAVHVNEAHDSWPAYIEAYELRVCDTCGDPLRTLTSRYCSDECQLNDPDPEERCRRCSNPVDRGQIFCSRTCYGRSQV